MSQSHTPISGSTTPQFQNKADKQNALLVGALNNWHNQERTPEQSNTKNFIIELFSDYRHRIRTPFSTGNTDVPLSRHIENITSIENYLFVAKFILKNLAPLEIEDRHHFFQTWFGYFFNDESKEKISAQYFESLYASPDKILAENLYWKELLEACPILFKNFSRAFLTRLAKHDQNLARMIVKNSQLDGNQKAELKHTYRDDLYIHFYLAEAAEINSFNFTYFLQAKNILDLYDLIQKNAKFKNHFLTTVTSHQITSLIQSIHTLPQEQQLEARNYLLAIFFQEGEEPIAEVKNASAAELFECMILAQWDGPLTIPQKIENKLKDEIQNITTLLSQPANAGNSATLQPNIQTTQKKLLTLFKSPRVRKILDAHKDSTIQYLSIPATNHTDITHEIITAKKEILKTEITLDTAEKDAEESHPLLSFFTSYPKQKAVKDYLKKTLVDENYNVKDFTQAQAFCISSNLLNIDWQDTFQKRWEFFGLSASYNKRMELIASKSFFLRHRLINDGILQLPPDDTIFKHIPNRQPEDLTLIELVLYSSSYNDQITQELTALNSCLFAELITQIDLHASLNPEIALENLAKLHAKFEAVKKLKDLLNDKIASISDEAFIKYTINATAHDRADNFAIIQSIPFRARLLNILSARPRELTPEKIDGIATIIPTLTQNVTLDTRTWVNLLDVAKVPSITKGTPHYLITSLPPTELENIFISASDEQISKRFDLFKSIFSKSSLSPALNNKITFLNKENLTRIIKENPAFLSMAVENSSPLNREDWEKLIDVIIKNPGSDSGEGVGHIVASAVVSVPKLAEAFLACSDIFISTHLNFFGSLFIAKQEQDSTAVHQPWLSQNNVDSLAEKIVTLLNIASPNNPQPLLTFAKQYPVAMIVAVTRKQNEIGLPTWENLLSLRNYTSSGEAKGYLILAALVPKNKWENFFTYFNDNLIQERMADFIPLFCNDDFTFTFLSSANIGEPLGALKTLLQKKQGALYSLNTTFKEACTENSSLAQKFLMALMALPKANNQIGIITPEDISDVIIAANLSGKQIWAFYDKGDAAKKVLLAALKQHTALKQHIDNINNFYDALALIDFTGDTKDILERLRFLHAANSTFYEQAAQQYIASASATSDNKMGLLALVAPAGERMSSADVKPAAKLTDEELQKNDEELQKNIALFNPFFVEPELDAFFEEHKTVHSVVLTRLFDANFESYTSDFVNPNFISSTLLEKDNHPEKLIRRLHVRDLASKKQGRLETTAPTPKAQPPKEENQNNNLPFDHKQTLADLKKRLGETIAKNQLAFLNALLATPKVCLSTSLHLPATDLVQPRSNTVTISYTGKSPLQIFEALGKDERRFITLLSEPSTLGADWKYNQIEELLKTDDVTPQLFVAFAQKAEDTIHHFFKIIFEQDTLPEFLLLLGQKIQMQESAFDTSTTEDKLKDTAARHLKLSLSKKSSLLPDLKQYKISKHPAESHTPKKKSSADVHLESSAPDIAMPSETDKKKMAGIISVLGNLKVRDKNTEDEKAKSFQIKPSDLQKEDKGNLSLDKDSQKETKKSDAQPQSQPQGRSMADMLSDSIKTTRKVKADSDSESGSDSGSDSDSGWSDDDNESRTPKTKRKKSSLPKTLTPLPGQSVPLKPGPEPLTKLPEQPKASSPADDKKNTTTTAPLVAPTQTFAAASMLVNPPAPASIPVTPSAESAKTPSSTNTKNEKTPKSETPVPKSVVTPPAHTSTTPPAANASDADPAVKPSALGFLTNLFGSSGKNKSAPEPTAAVTAPHTVPTTHTLPAKPTAYSPGLSEPGHGDTATSTSSVANIAAHLGPNLGKQKPSSAASATTTPSATAKPLESKPTSGAPKTKNPQTPIVKEETLPAPEGSTSTTADATKEPVPPPPTHPAAPPPPKVPLAPPPPAAPKQVMPNQQSAATPAVTLSSGMDSGLMAQIQAGKGLKKTVTVDKSGPNLGTPSTNPTPEPTQTAHSGAQQQGTPHSATPSQAGAQPKLGSVNMASAKAGLKPKMEQKKSPLDILLDGIGEIKFEETSGKTSKFKASPIEPLKNAIKTFVTNKKNKDLSKEAREEKLQSLLNTEFPKLIDDAKWAIIQSLIETYVANLSAQKPVLVSGNKACMFPTPTSSATDKAIPEANNSKALAPS